MIQLSDLKNKVIELGTVYPNAIYAPVRCEYHMGVVTNGPETEGCLIGQAIRLLNPTLPELIAENGGNFKEILQTYPTEFDTSEEDSASIADWLGRVQDVQDNHLTWGEAISVDLGVECD